ncbi:MAG: DNA recombination protein RmuC [Clostridia bacterium]|nr:DNA recombination protein RmuC [Clostridia bacterium]MDD4798723.1 DNA recombination protein RmuC [Clostridia bacterium]
MNDLLTSGLLSVIIILLVVCIVLVSKNKPQNGEEAQKRLSEFLLGEMNRLSQENSRSEARLREEIASLRRDLQAQSADNNDKLLRQVMLLSESNEKRLQDVRNVVDNNLQKMTDNNDKKLDEMRQVVDEKLQKTLETRLGESFKQVSTRLEQVHQGLGEMHTLATDVGDLKKVLANVKTRGTWGEVQLGALLEQILAPSQYVTNYAVNPDQPANRVEYAVRLPGRDKDQPVYLPIDAKFPLEDYQLLLKAQDEGNLEQIALSGKALENRIKLFAKDVQSKYLQPPYTTDFALIFLPLEGLYSEILRREGLADLLQRDYRVTIVGPTTIAALLNSLQMGFRTLAIEQKADEAWKTLSTIRTGFSEFEKLLEKTQKKLQEASNSIDTAARKTRVIDRRLKKVSSLEDKDEVLLSELAASEDFVADE